MEGYNIKRNCSKQFRYLPLCTTIRTQMSLNTERYRKTLFWSDRQAVWNRLTLASCRWAALKSVTQRALEYKWNDRKSMEMNSQRFLVAGQEELDSCRRVPPNERMNIHSYISMNIYDVPIKENTWRIRDQWLWQLRYLNPVSTRNSSLDVSAVKPSWQIISHIANTLADPSSVSVDSALAAMLRPVSHPLHFHIFQRHQLTRRPINSFVDSTCELFSYSSFTLDK